MEKCYINTVGRAWQEPKLVSFSTSMSLEQIEKEAHVFERQRYRYYLYYQRKSKLIGCAWTS